MSESGDTVQDEIMSGLKKIPSITDADLYVKQSTDESSDKSTDLKLSTLSWASQVEEELGTSIEDTPLSGSGYLSVKGSSDNLKDLESINMNTNTSTNTNTNTNTNINTSTNLTIETILNLNLKDHIDIVLLEHQTTMANHLRKQIKIHVEKQLQNKNKEKFNFDGYIEKLKWMQKISAHFSKKLELSKIVHTHGNKVRSIPRSSYKFCDYGHDCEFNYNHKKHKGCFAQHFVHNHIEADLNALVEYVSQVKDNSFDNIKFIEIIKCTNTVSYVIGHMYEELKYVEYYHKGKSDIFHKERTPSGKRQKKKFKGKKGSNKIQSKNA